MSSLNPHLPVHADERWGAAPRGPSTLALRARVLRRRSRLDAMLARGAAAEESPELTLRAAQLTGRRHRATLADSLEDVVRTAEGHGLRRTVRPPLAGGEVRAARAALLGLAYQLRQSAGVQPAGVVLTQRLITDGTGPLYVHAQNDALWHAAREAGAALAGERT